MRRDTKGEPAVNENTSIVLSVDSLWREVSSQSFSLLSKVRFLSQREFWNYRILYCTLIVAQGVHLAVRFITGLHSQATLVNAEHARQHALAEALDEDDALPESDADAEAGARKSTRRVKRRVYRTPRGALVEREYDLLVRYAASILKYENCILIQ